MRSWAHFTSGCQKLVALLTEALLKKHISLHSLHEPGVLEQQAKYDASLEVLSGDLGSLMGREEDKLERVMVCPLDHGWVHTQSAGLGKPMSAQIESVFFSWLAHQVNCCVMTSNHFIEMHYIDMSYFIFGTSFKMAKLILFTWKLVLLHFFLARSVCASASQEGFLWVVVEMPEGTPPASFGLLRSSSFDRFTCLHGHSIVLRQRYLRPFNTTFGSFP